ncbi:ABC transporter ATP-binding protein [Candidatus Uabimicrobium amorphum]|uniref:ABC transporter ATP-binding protein n=1 Tax=Uabimicrobium amorphum TaxID=2596890 RepID=A0A5S9IHQ0_UABAM|nr:ABC transporter ATP-binding protein [Candidatus Uabimicrobium amorphum]BBM82018.1 ABC transporter ATP-binding protein [Candidatus Uabimicrobium amorphum]
MPNALNISQLKKSYGSLEALKGISFCVQQGDFFALLGPNGAGKSTTIGIISSLVNKSSGSVEIFGYDIQRQKNIAKKHIGLVPQEFNFSIFEQVMQIVVNQAGYYGIPRKVAVPRAEELLNKLGLWEKRSSVARTLSGGMKRKLMIVRALLHNPQLLILDEPTAGVDVETRREMWDFLTQLNTQGTTIILTTHYLEEAEQLCKNIAIIDHGEIIQNTSMKKLLAQLDHESFIIDTRDEINELQEVEGYSLQKIDNNTIRLDLHKDQNLNNVIAKLSEQDIQIKSMRNKANRLEELFIRLTKK